MATTKQKVTYKRFNGTDWDTIYFTTSAASVLETKEKRFINPGAHTVNGKSFFNASNVAQGITLDDADISLGSDSSKVFTDLSSYNVASALVYLKEYVDSVSEQIEGATGGGVVTGITTPTLTAAKGVVDLSADFANYLPLTGGTLSGDLIIKDRFAFAFDGNKTIITKETVKSEHGNFTDVTVSGNATIANLVVTGTTTTVNTTNLEVSDNLIVVAKDNTVALANPAGLLIPHYDAEGNAGALFFDSNGTAYVGDVGLNSDNNQIDMSSSKTTALPLVVRKNTTYTGNGTIAIWDVDDGNPYLMESDQVINSAAASFASKDSNINTYGAMKTKVAGALSFANNVLTLKAVDGTTSLGSATLGAASTKAVDTSITYTSSSVNLPTTTAVNTYVKNYSNRTFYASTTPTDARTGDLWFDTAGSSSVTA